MKWLAATTTEHQFFGGKLPMLNEGLAKALRLFTYTYTTKRNNLIEIVFFLQISNICEIKIPILCVLQSIWMFFKYIERKRTPYNKYSSE